MELYSSIIGYKDRTAQQRSFVKHGKYISIPPKDYFVEHPKYFLSSTCSF
jgi:hypothetical protein